MSLAAAAVGPSVVEPAQHGEVGPVLPEAAPVVGQRRAEHAREKHAVERE